jgi:hypothetical protein
MSKYIEALLLEREGYVRRNLQDRVKQVDEELARNGFSHKYLKPIETAASETEVETATVKRGRKPKDADGNS